MITFFNAGAGSGKTYTLSEQLYLFLTVQNGNPNEVILTTFTIKAAEELKERVRQRLLEKGEAAKAAEMSNALIGTINGVCSSLVEKYSLEHCLSANLKVLDEASIKTLFENFLTNNIDDSVYQELNRLSYRFSLYESNDYRQKQVLKPCWPDLVKKMVEKFRSYNFTQGQMTTSKEAAIEKIAAFLVTKDDLKIDSLLASLNNGPNWFDNRDPLAGDLATLEALKQFSRKKNKQDFQWCEFEKAAKGLTKTFIKKNPDVADVVDKIASYYQTLLFKQEWIRLTELLYDTAFDLIQRYQQYKKERGLIDFTDQEALLLEMLQANETVKKEIKDTYKLIMVDEFQDCSPLQIAVFTKLQQLIKETIWVGDPKQSIYGFRGADEQLFTRTMNAVEANGNKIQILDTCYRSRPAIVEAANQIFSGIFNGILPPDRIALKPSKECMERENGYNDNSLQVIFCEAGNLDSYYTILAEKIKAIIDSPRQVYEISGNRFRKIRGNDIALLFRDRANMGKMAEVLRNAQVPVSIESGGFKQQAEVLWMSGLIRLLINPFDSLAIANLLLLEDTVHNVEELIVERLNYLHAKVEDTEQPHWREHSEIAKRIVAHENLISQMPLVQAMQLLVSISDLPLYAARWGNYDVRISNINQIITLAKLYQEQCGMLGIATTLSGFLDILQNHDRIPAIDSVDAVQLLTVHESKGLEWPMVIPVKLDVSMKHCRHIFNTIHVIQPTEFDLNDVLKSQLILYLVWPFASREKVPSGLEEAAGVLNEQLHAYWNAQKEEDRLLYVALTRAKEYLLFTADTTPKTYSGIESSTRFNPSPLFTKEHLLHLLQEAKSTKSSIIPGSQLVITVEIAMGVETLEETCKDTAPAFVSWYDHGKAVTPSVFTKRFISPSEMMDDDITSVIVNDLGLVNSVLSVCKDNQISDEALGNAIHLAFASWNPEDPKERRISVIEMLFSRLGLYGHTDSALLDDNFEGFWKFLQKKYNPTKVWREFSLNLVAEANREVITGIADLVLETEGELVLVDHKTFRGSFDKQVMNRENAFYAGKYNGQLSSYKNLLEQATGKKVSAGLIHYVMQGRLVELV